VIRSFVGAETLCQAVDACAGGGGTDDLALLLRVGADIDALVEGKNVLMRGVCSASLPAVEMLVEEGANLETEGEEGTDKGFTALVYACDKSHPEMVKFLVSRGQDTGHTPLSYAAYKGPLGIFEFLLSKGADVGKSVFEGTTVLHQAASGNQREIAEMILDRGLVNDVNVRNDALETPFLWTACHGIRDHMTRDSDAVADLLIARGADVHARNRGGNPFFIMQR